MGDVCSAALTDDVVSDESDDSPFTFGLKMSD